MRLRIYIVIYLSGSASITPHHVHFYLAVAIVAGAGSKLNSGAALSFLCLLSWSKCLGHLKKEMSSSQRACRASSSLDLVTREGKFTLGAYLLNFTSVGFLRSLGFANWPACPSLNSVNSIFDRYLTTQAINMPLDIAHERQLAQLVQLTQRQWAQPRPLRR